MTPEGRIKTEIRKWLTAKQIFWSSIQNGPGAKPGDPDLIICFQGSFIGVEVKAPGGVQSPLQKVREKEINASGGRYLIVHSLKELEEALML